MAKIEKKVTFDTAVSEDIYQNTFGSKERQTKQREQRIKKILVNLTETEYQKLLEQKDNEGKKYMPDAIYVRELINVHGYGK